MVDTVISFVPMNTTGEIKALSYQLYSLEKIQKCCYFKAKGNTIIKRVAQKGR